MNKASLRKLKKSNKEAVDNRSKSDLMAEISNSLKQIGFNVMGVFASPKDDEEFLRLYAKLAKHKALSLHEGANYDTVYERSNMANLKKILPSD